MKSQVEFECPGRCGDGTADEGDEVVEAGDLWRMSLTDEVRSRMFADELLRLRFCVGSEFKDSPSRCMRKRKIFAPRRQRVCEDSTSTSAGGTWE